MCPAIKWSIWYFVLILLYYRFVVFSSSNGNHKTSKIGGGGPRHGQLTEGAPKVELCHWFPTQIFLKVNTKPSWIAFTRDVIAIQLGFAFYTRFQNYTTFHENILRSNVGFMSYLLLKIGNVNKRDFKLYFIYNDEYWTKTM